MGFFKWVPFALTFILFLVMIGTNIIFQMSAGMKNPWNPFGVWSLSSHDEVAAVIANREEPKKKD